MTTRVDLDGQWRLLHSDGERGRVEYALAEEIEAWRYFDATVPGSVHLDLMQAGLIQDPVIGLNSLSARWVEECKWAYRREFTVDESALGGHAWLVFEALDLNATIFLNGVKVGEHANVFLPCRIDVADRLNSGTNTLVVVVESGIIEAGDKPAEGLGSKDAYHYSQKLHKQHWLRKPAYQFGWDWTARLTNVGISGSVVLELSHEPLRVDTLVPLVEVDDDLKTASVTVRGTVQNVLAEPQTVSFEVELDELGLSLQREFVVQPGTHTLEVTGEVEGFDLWWPVGCGEARLYQLQAWLGRDGARQEFPGKRVGFRHVRVNQDPHPESGNYCVVEVNHRRIFLKGANWVPADMIPARVDADRYVTLIDRALEANFNFLRIWGGGLYESDVFYQQCDEKGILVWQEFTYACRKYPLNDEALYQSALAEARYQIKRLACHPSLVIWCGNNEMEWGNWEWGFDKGVIYPDYAFFHLVLPRLMQEEDPTRYYQPSSPFSPDGASPNLDDRGDQHNWSVSLGHSDYREFRDMSCRLMNEGGYLGPTSLPGMKACFPEGQQPVIGDFAWYHHDNSVDSWHLRSLPNSGFQEHMGREPRELQLEEYVYQGGLLHGEALATYIDNFRRRKYDSSAACFWMFNDCWPATRSWTIVDYGLRRTPGFWAVKRAFAPVTVVVTHEAGAYQVFGVNDSDAVVAATLACGFIKAAGSFADTESSEVTLPANASTLLATFAAPGDPTLSVDTIAFATLHGRQDQALLARNRYIGPKLCEMQLAPPEITIELNDGHAEFVSPVLVLGVCIDLEGEQALADNFFDLYPGQPYRIAWPHPTPPSVIATLNSVVNPPA